MWCPVVAPRKPPQAPRSSQAATQPAASEPGPSTPPPAKRSKPAAEPSQPTKGKGKGKAARAKPAPQPGRWLDRDCNAALNMQRIGESKWRPLELCYWPDQGALPAKGKEYPGLGYKRLRDQPSKAQQQQQQPAEAHVTTTTTLDAVWEVYLDPKWARQRLRLYRAQDRELQQFFKVLEEEMAEVSMKRHGRAKQLVVFFGAASIGTRGGWGADAVLRACCKVVCRPRGAGQLWGRVVLVDEHRTIRVSSAVNGQQPCEEELDHEQPTRPAGWKPPAGQVDLRLLRPAWSQQRDQPVRGLMWCPVVAPRKPPQAPCSSQEATTAAASEPGPSTPPPAKRSKRTEAEQAAEPTQSTKGQGQGQGKAAKAKPAPQPGRRLDRDCNAALNMQRIGESRWRPLELCYWPDEGALPAKGKEYPGLGYKRLRDKPPKAQQQQQPVAHICDGLTMLFSMAKKKRRTVPRLVPEDPDSDIEDRDEALQPDLTEAQQNRKASGEARAARDRDNTYHARKCKIAHLIDHLPQELWDAFLDEAVQPRVEACSERGVLASLLFGLLVRGLFTIRVADPLGLHDQPVYTDIPVSQAAIPDLSCRNLFLQLVRGLPGNGANTQPNAAVAAVLAAHPDLRARLAAIPRHLSDTNMVDHVGKQLETAFSNMLTILFAGRLKKSVSLAGAKVLVGTEEHRRRFGFWGVGGGHLPAWSKRQCTYVRRMVCGLDVSWLVGEGGVVPTAAMQAEVALQRGLLGLEEGERVDDDWVKDPANRGRLLRHAVHTTREMEAAMAAWQLDMVPWQQAELTNPGLLPRPPRPPTPYAITPTSKCRARHVFIDTRGLYGMMRDAGMLGVLTEQGVTSLAKFRNGALPDPARPGHYIEGLKDSHVANRWDALLPDPRRQKLASPKHSFAQIVHTDGVAISVMFLRPKPAAPPAELPRMGRGLGAVNPLAHLDAEWLGVDPGKSNMATVAHEERSAAGTVVSVRHWKLTAGQYYRDSGITRQTQATKTWLAKVEPQLTALSRVSSKPSSLASYRRFADTVLETYDAMWAEVSKKRWANAKFRLYCGKMRVVASFWAKVKKQAQKRWPDRILALAYGAASFSGSGSIGCRGVPVSQMRKEAVQQFGAGRVVLVDEFRTSRVSSAYSHPIEALPGQPPESFRWLRPVYSEAKRSQVRGLMSSTSYNIRFYDRDVSAALNIRRCAVGPGPRPTELCYWDGRPAMPKPGRPGQEWVYLRDKALLRNPISEKVVQMGAMSDEQSACVEVKAEADTEPVAQPGESSAAETAAAVNKIEPKPEQQETAVPKTEQQETAVPKTEQQETAEVKDEAADEPTAGEGEDNKPEADAAVAGEGDEADGGVEPEVVKSADHENEEGPNPAPAQDPVKLGYVEFKDAAEGIRFFRQLLLQSCKNVDMNEYEHLALLDLLKAHPDKDRKLGLGVRSFQVREYPTDDQQQASAPRAFYAIRKDGSAEDFSYLKCINLYFPGQLAAANASNKRPRTDRGDTAGRGSPGGRGGRGGGMATQKRTTREQTLPHKGQGHVGITA
ncbi:hypothetical protein QJQ45_030063 [Haematococcus lacustris]|nr:hypothetical protein QJQ45_030063 [Haematococcus lacustris]